MLWPSSRFIFSIYYLNLLFLGICLKKKKHKTLPHIVSLWHSCQCLVNVFKMIQLFCTLFSYLWVYINQYNIYFKWLQYSCYSVEDTENNVFIITIIIIVYSFLIHFYSGQTNHKIYLLQCQNNENYWIRILFFKKC